MAGLRIAVINDNPARGAVLETGLREAGLEDVHVLGGYLAGGRAGLVARLAELSPDAVLIDLENPSRDVFEEALRVARAVARPVALFLDRSDEAMAAAAVDAGVSAYVVDGLRKERVKPILDLAIGRFNHQARLAAELEAAKSALAERKLIDRAKGLLMRQRGIDEAAAYALLRGSAMKQGRKIADIAQAVITADALLGGDGVES